MDEVFTILRVVVSLGVVVGVIWFVQRKFVRSSRTKSNKRPVSIVARQSVGRNSSVAVVEFQGKQFLLGVTEHGISVLDSVPNAAEEVVTAPGEPIEEPTVRAIRPVTRRASSKEFAAVLTGIEAPAASAAASVAASVVAPVAAPVTRVARTKTAVPEVLTASFKRPAPGSPPLAGSILSTATWKQAFAAIKSGR